MPNEFSTSQSPWKVLSGNHKSDTNACEAAGVQAETTFAIGKPFGVMSNLTVSISVCFPPVQNHNKFTSTLIQVTTEFYTLDICVFCKVRMEYIRSSSGNG